MILLIFSPQCRKIVPKWFTVTVIDIIVKHALLPASFHLFAAALVALLFKLFSFLLTHGYFWKQCGEVFGTKSAAPNLNRSVPVIYKKPQFSIAAIRFFKK
jgi:hypothetical protein